MRKRFTTRAKAAWHGRFLAVCIIIFLAVACMEVYRAAVPFVSANPLWTQVTIGQPVIGKWMYGGVDEEGYLKFYNSSTASPPILLPPNSHLFDADGKFVILEGHTPSSLTYAQPYEAVPVKWIAIAFTVVAVPGGLLWLKWRHRLRRLHTRAVQSSRLRSMAGRVVWVPLRRPKRNKRFRPNRR